MHLINKDFENLIENVYLTENVSLLLYSWIRTTRPLQVLEVGAGYSTICIAKAFDDIQKEELNPKVNKEIWKHFRQHDHYRPESLHEKKLYKFYGDNFVEDSQHTGSKYNPKLTTIDNSIDSGSSKLNGYKKIHSILDNFKLRKYVEFINGDWESEIHKLPSETKYDFVWIDLGSGLEYKRYFDTIFPKLNPGGFISFHNVATNVACRLFLTEMKLKSKVSDEFEMIVLHEPHKKRQNGIALFKKNCEYPLYNMVAL